MKVTRLGLLLSFWLFALATLCIVPASGQGVSDANQSGFPTFSTHHGSDLDLVSLNNGNLHIDIPIASFPQRNGRNFAYRFIYDTPPYTLTYYKDPGGVYWSADLANGVGIGSTAGWRLSNPVNWQLDYVIEPLTTCPDTGYGLQIVDHYSIIDPDGAKHPLTLRSATPCGSDLGSQLQSLALDGTGTFVDISSSPKIILKDGTQIVAGVYRDANGNSASSSSDMLGRNDVTTTTASAYTLYTVRDSNGNSQIYRVDLTALNVTTNFCPLRSGRPGGAATCDDYAGTWQVPARLTLPDGTSYQFTWNSDGTLQRIDLPTGGSIAYAYVSMRFNGVYSGAACIHTDPSCIPQTNYPVRQVVTSRAVTANGTTATWYYAGYANGTAGSGLPAGATTVTDPLGNQQVHTFSGDPSLETQVKYYQGSSSAGTLLRTVNKDYASDCSPLVAACGQIINVRLIRETTILENGLTKKAESDYETTTASCGACAGLSTYTATWLNPSNVREYDWGSGSPGPLLRTTSNTYLHAGNSNYLNANIADRPTSTTVYDGNGNIAEQTTFAYDGSSLTATSGAPNHDYTNFSTSNTLRGNRTQTSQWLNTNNSWISTTNTYDDLGNVRSTTDPLSHTTTFSYNDNFSGSGCIPGGVNTQAYVTQVTNALGQNTRTKYFPCTGLAAAHQDQNDINASRAGTTFTYDFMNRPLAMNFPDGGQTSFSYPSATEVDRTQKLTSSVNKTSSMFYDALARPTSALLQTGTGTVQTDTTYDLLGRVSTVSNPYYQGTNHGTDPTYGLTTTHYDALGRVTQIVRPDGTAANNWQDGSTVNNYYIGNCVQANDEINNARTGCNDGLGRLTLVWENPGGLDYRTDYQYDTLGNLLRVDQKGAAYGDSSQWRTRTFTYDSLSRLLTATNPESGTISYAYDAAGNLTSKTDARNISIGYQYDQLNRMILKTPSDGSPIVNLTYDQSSVWGHTLTNGTGRLTSEGIFPAWGQPYIQAALFGYDAMGRMLNQWECLPSGCPSSATYQISAAYDLAGDLTSLNYPDGRAVNYVYDSAGRASSVADSVTGGYVWGASYWPNGAQFQLHSANVYFETDLNARLQPAKIYADNGQVSAFYVSKSYNYGFPNNGNVLSITNNKDSNRSQSFTYDALNRLTHAENQGTDCSTLLPDGHTEYWGSDFVYDAWGNLLHKNVTKCSAEPLNVVALANNRLSGYSYDAAGNMTNDSFHTYAYNADDQLTSMDNGAETYLYNSSGGRVRKSSSGGYTEYVSFGGNMLAELRNVGGLTSSMLSASGLTAFNPGNIITGQPSGQGWGWSTDSSVAGAWLQVDFGLNNGQDVIQVNVLTNTSTCCDPPYAGNYTVQYSDNGSSWSTAASNFVPAYAGWNSARWTSAGVHRWWRLYLTNTPGPGAWLNQLQLVGETNYVFFNGKRVARRDTTGGIHFYLSDHLGSTSMVVNSAGTIENESEFYPFGGELQYSAADSGNHYKFTGKERDTESSLDYFSARYYSSTLGRFATPDPLLNSGRPRNPQSWNRYAYVGNNPLRNVDPTGLYFFTNTCHKDDSACNAAFAQTQKNVRNMYAATQAAYEKAIKNGDTKAAAALKRTLDGLGAEGQKNARGQTVNISVNLSLNAPGETGFAPGSTSTINIVLNPGMSNGEEAAQVEAAHEGVHAGEITPGKPTWNQAYGLEQHAYETESYFSQAIGFQDIRSPSDGSDMVNGVLDPRKDFVLWSPSWANVDAATVDSLRSKGVNAAAKDGANVDCAAIGGCKK